MSVTMDENIKRWAAKRKTALVVEFNQGKTTVADSIRPFEALNHAVGLATALTSHDLPVRIGFEATSNYHLALAHHLCKPACSLKLLPSVPFPAFCT